MGNNPSRNLYYAARSGDIQLVENALAEGGDINYKNPDKYDQTPLIVAAKHGRTDAVRWLLAKKALDHKTTQGESALAMAAKMGHHAVVAVLLDHGSDYSSTNAEGMRPIDQASAIRHTAVVRLIEARVCPFVGRVEMEKSGWLSSYFDTVWISVSRARPWDNPSMDRRDVRLSIYRDITAAIPEVVLLRPAVQPLSGDNIVEFQLVPEVTLVGSRPAPNKNIRARLPRDMYNWLVAVLSDSFGAGRGAAFDPQSGLIVMTDWGSEYAAQFATTAWAQFRMPPPIRIPEYREMTPGGAHGPPMGTTVPLRPAQARAARMQPAPQGIEWSAPVHGQAVQPVWNGTGMPTAVPVALGPVPAPSAPVMRGAATPPQRQAPGPPVAAPVAAPVASPTPAYWTPALAALQRDVSEGLDFSVEPPEQYVCPITADVCIDPVVAADGHTYSRAGIQAWLALKRTSPKTNEIMETDHVFPNHLLRGEILAWIETHRLAQGVTRKQAEAQAQAETQAQAKRAANAKPPSSAFPVQVASAPQHVRGASFGSDSLQSGYVPVSLSREDSIRAGYLPRAAPVPYTSSVEPQPHAPSAPASQGEEGEEAWHQAWRMGTAQDSRRATQQTAEVPGGNRVATLA